MAEYADVRQLVDMRTLNVDESQNPVNDEEPRRCKPCDEWVPVCERRLQVQPDLDGQGSSLDGLVERWLFGCILHGLDFRMEDCAKIGLQPLQRIKC